MQSVVYTAFLCVQVCILKSIETALLFVKWNECHMMKLDIIRMLKWLLWAVQRWERSVGSGAMPLLLCDTQGHCRGMLIDCSLIFVYLSSSVAPTM